MHSVHCYFGGKIAVFIEQTCLRSHTGEVPMALKRSTKRNARMTVTKFIENNIAKPLSFAPVLLHWVYSNALEKRFLNSENALEIPPVERSGIREANPGSFEM